MDWLLADTQSGKCLRDMLCEYGVVIWGSGYEMDEKVATLGS